MKTKDGPRGPGLVFLENVKVKKNQSLEEIVKRESEKPRQTSHTEFSAHITKDKIEFSAGKSRKKVPINEILYEHIERILPEERKLRVILGCMTGRRRNVCSFQFADYGAYNTFMYYLYEARGWLIESEGNAFSASPITPKSPETDTSVQYSIQPPGLPSRTTNTGLTTSFIKWESGQHVSNAEIQAGSIDSSSVISSLSESCECCGGCNGERTYADENAKPSPECDTLSNWTCSCGRNTRQLPPQARQTQTSRPCTPAVRARSSCCRTSGAADDWLAHSRSSLDSPTIYISVPHKHSSQYEEVLPEFDDVKVYRAKLKTTSSPRSADRDKSQGKTTYRKISTGAPSSGYSSATMLTDNALELTVTGQNHGEYITDKSVYIKRKPKGEPERLVYTKDPSLAPPLKRY